MSLLFCDGFSHYNNLLQKWTLIFEAMIQPAAGRGGRGGCVIQAGGSIAKSLGLRQSIYCGAAVQANPSNSGYGGPLYVLAAIFKSGGVANLASVVVEADGSISLYAGAPHSFVIANSASATPPFFLVENVFFYIEWHISLGGSTPISVTAAVNVNTVQVAAGGGNTTVNAADLLSEMPQGDFHVFGYVAGGTTVIGDVYINDTVPTAGLPVASGFRGDVAVGPFLVPRQDSGTAWSESTGAPPSYPLVNTVPPSIGTYIYDYQVGDVDSFLLTTLATFVGEIQAAQLCVYMSKDGEGSRSVSPTVGGAVQAAAPAWFVSDDAFIYTYPMDTDPTSNSIWTVADVNAQTFGVAIAS